MEITSFTLFIHHLKLSKGIVNRIVIKMAVKNGLIVHSCLQPTAAHCAKVQRSRPQQGLSHDTGCDVKIVLVTQGSLQQWGKRPLWWVYWGFLAAFSIGSVVG